MNDKLLPAKLAYFRSTCAIFEPFLKEFQTDAPVAPLLYNNLKSLLLTLIEKVVKQEHLDSVKKRIEKVDFSPSNLIPVKHVDLGFATKDALKKCLPTTDLEKLNLKKDIRDAVIAMAKKIIEKSPIQYKMSKAITCLDPSVVKSGATENHVNKCLEELVEKKWLTGIKADAVKYQYSKLMSQEHVLEKCKMYKRREKRLDEFYTEILNEEDSDKYKELTSFIKIILSLSHGNASVERGFSVNKQCIVENLKEESLIALRKVCEGVRAAGGIEEFEITTELIHSTKNSHARYTEHLLKQREQSKEKTLAEKEKKQAVKEKMDLEAQRFEILSEARKRTAELDSKIEELSKKAKY